MKIMPPPETNSTTTLFQTSAVPEFAPNLEQWKLWKEKLEIHFCEINCEEDNRKKAILLKAIGAEAYRLVHSLCSPASPVSKSYKELCEILNDHYTPPSIVFKERQTFHCARMGEGETVSQWHARVKELAIDCKFGIHLEAFLLQQFVNGLPEKIFEKICEEDDTLTLQIALRKALIRETKINDKSKTEKGHVNFIKNNTPSTDRHKTSNNFNNHTRQNNKSQSNNKIQDGGKSACVCHYKSRRCNTCKKIGHLASICRKKNNKNINFVSTSNTNSVKNISNFSVYSVRMNDAPNAAPTTYSLPVAINGISASVICDTGSPRTLVPHRYLRKFQIKDKLAQCKIPFLNYSGDLIDILGEVKVDITYKNFTKKLTIVISKTDGPPLLGRDFFRNFKFELVQVNNINIEHNYDTIANKIKREFANIFDGKLGLYNIRKVSLSIDEQARPIFCKPRSIPLAWKDKVEQQLKTMNWPRKIQVYATPNCVSTLPWNEGTFFRT